MMQMAKFNTIFFFLAAYVAPSIVSSNIGSGTINFGSVQVHTWSPWDTMPFLQLPGWTVATVYTMILGLFVLYFANIIGSFITGFSSVSNIFSSKLRDTTYSSKMRYLCLMKWPSKMLQNLSYFWYMKTHVVFFIQNIWQILKRLARTIPSSINLLFLKSVHF